jgi:hypothetical protein
VGSLFTTRRSQWLPGVAVLAAVFAVGVLAGGAFGPEGLLLVAGALAIGVGAAALAARLRRPRRAAPPPAAGSERRTRPSRLGAKVGVDLASEQETKHQRYLM